MLCCDDDDAIEIEIVQNTSKPPCHDQENQIDEEVSSDSIMCECNDCNQNYDQPSFQSNDLIKFKAVQSPIFSKIAFMPPQKLDHPPQYIFINTFF